MTRRGRAGAVDDVWPGELVAARVHGVPVVLVHAGGRVCAYVDRCDHLGVAISEGVLDGGVITCRAHCWQYDAATGRGVNPRTAALRPLPVTVRDGQIYVDVEEVAHD